MDASTDLGSHLKWRKTQQPDQIDELTNHIAEILAKGSELSERYQMGLSRLDKLCRTVGPQTWPKLGQILCVFQCWLLVNLIGLLV